MPRAPASCPANFAGHYTVNPGNTMFIISSIYRIKLSELIRANPHITNPNHISPGDVLCVPGQVSFPYCVPLEAVQPSELGVAGVALVYTNFVGAQAVSVMAIIDTLPAEFDILMAEVHIPSQLSARQQLYPTPQTPPTFSGTLNFPTAASLTQDTIINVFPANSTSGNQGSVKLQGRLPNSPSSSTDANSIVYQNTQYGFSFKLPVSWKGYSIVNSLWEGQASQQSSQVVETGPIISIRDPKWTAQTPRQDIPIMVFTHDQWNSLQKDVFHIGAAPIGPSELGRNNSYVLALPARYNYAYPQGYKDVETILESKPLQTTETR